MVTGTKCRQNDTSFRGCGTECHFYDTSFQACGTECRQNDTSWYCKKRDKF